jgi:hypothetical protein
VAADVEEGAAIAEAVLEVGQVVVDEVEGACNDPGFYQILGNFFFTFVLLEMIEISQGFKTFESI